MTSPASEPRCEECGQPDSDPDPVNGRIHSPDHAFVPPPDPAPEKRADAEPGSLLDGTTPGPWETLADGNTGVYLLHAEKFPKDCLVARVGFGFGRPNEEHQANARLIAAAPDLAREVERLRGAVLLMKKWIEGVNIYPDHFDSMMKQVEAALAEAKPEARGKG